MSYYYNYYLGYKFENKFYPIGPFNHKGDFIPIISRSRSFASNWHDDFSIIKDNEKSQELEDVLPPDETIKFYKFNENENDNFMRRGYYLIKDVVAYEQEPYWWDAGDWFYNSMTPLEYAEKLQKEMLYNLKPIPVDVDEESELEYSSCAADYMYYSYPDFNSVEYEKFLVNAIRTSLIGYSTLPKGAEVVVLETEG